MKKLLVALFIVALLASPVYASQVTEQIFEAAITSANTIDSGDTSLAECSKSTFFITYDETEVLGAVSAAITTQLSYDGTNWATGYFFDFAGGTTLQTSETISSDGTYVFWFDPNITAPYVKVIATATCTADTLSIIAEVVKAK